LKLDRALFLDRDGTLIVDKVYLSDPAGIEIFPGVADGLRHARTLGYRLFLFTNQSGIGRGYHTVEDTHRVNASACRRRCSTKSASRRKRPISRRSTASRRRVSSRT
jgi:HAD superfamily hydrolase (TIGR01662 family)